MCVIRRRSDPALFCFKFLHQTDSHCEPVRTLVWQSVFPIRRRQNKFIIDIFKGKENEYEKTRTMLAPRPRDGGVAAPSERAGDPASCGGVCLRGHELAEHDGLSGGCQPGQRQDPVLQGRGQLLSRHLEQQSAALYDLRHEQHELDAPCCRERHLFLQCQQRQGDVLAGLDEMGICLLSF